MAALRKDVDAESGLLSERIRTIAGTRLQQILGQPAVPVDDVQGDGLGLEGRQLVDRRFDHDGYELARGLDLQWLVSRNVEIRHVPVRIQHRSQNVIEFGFSHGITPTPPAGSSASPGTCSYRYSGCRRLPR